MNKNSNSLILKLLCVLLLANGTTAFAKSKKSNFEKLPAKKIKSVEFSNKGAQKQDDAEEADDEDSPPRSPAAESSSASTNIGGMPPSVNINSYPYGNLYDSYQEEFSAEVSQKDAENFHCRMCV
jgi:hypothetical protein